MADISVLLCAYTEPYDQFNLALQSVAYQTFPPKQIIIVDDSGEAKFEKQCEEFNKSMPKERNIQIVYVANSRNEGLVSSLNRGSLEASCEYIARMDADDISLPYRFQKQVNLLDLGYDIVGGGITSFNTAGQLRSINYPSTRLGVLYSLLRNNPIAHPLVMYKRDVLQRLQGYRSVDYAEDLDLWMRAYLSGYRITNSPYILLLRRLHKEQLSSIYSREQESGTNVLRRNFIRQLLND
jgi:cellulose synthase/poly-beta-1,6-N-acetylglucosamine synthase-like glycosyltransferase